MPIQPTVRLRLTLIYGGLFLAAGALLLVLNYGLVRRSLPEPTFAMRLAPEPLPGDILPVPIEGRPHEGLLGPGENPVTADGRPLFEVIKAQERRIRDRTMQELVTQSSIALGIMAVASIGFGWVMAGRVLRPLHDITATARRLSRENLHERISLPGPQDELKELADTFDAMLERLDRAFEAQARFIANASHELRTPLAIERTLIDVALADPDASIEDLRAMAEKVRATTFRSERLIDGLLVLARSDRGLATREPIDLSEVAAESASGVAPEAAARGVTIQTGPLLPAPTEGDRSLLERLAENLLENAVRHNVDGGVVSVVTESNGEAVTLRVENSGPVIPADRVADLFEPFRRVDDRTRSDRGAGLGLSIVRSIARVHGGEVEATPRPEGGLAVRVRLPAPGKEPLAKQAPGEQERRAEPGLGR